MKKNGDKARSQDADLAVVEIDKPIGHHIFRPINRHILPHPEDKRSDNQGILVARHFNGNLVSEGSTELLPPGCVDTRNGMAFIIKHGLGSAGMLGAPIINASWHVISILSLGFCAVAYGNTIPNSNKSNIFAGAKPERIASLVDDIVFRLPTPP